MKQIQDKAARNQHRVLVSSLKSLTFRFMIIHIFQVSFSLSKEAKDRTDAAAKIGGGEEVDVRCKFVVNKVS